MRKLHFFAVLGTVALGASLSSHTQAQDAAKEIKFCAGSSTGNYTFAANEIANRLKGDFKVTVITTEGSLDNLKRLERGECDMAFAQQDVADLYRLDNPASANTVTPFKAVYNEYAQLLCPSKAGWFTLDDIIKARANGTPVKFITGPNGTGNAETFRAFRQSDVDAYKKFETKPDKVDRSAISTVKDSPDTCMLWISGLNSGDMKLANEMSVRTTDKKPSLRLISIDNEKIRDIKDGEGRPVYEFKKIKAEQPDNATGKPGFYQNLIADRSSWYSSADNTVTVPVVRAWLYTTQTYKAALGSDKANRIVDAVEESQPTIWNRVDPQSK